jgi:hypothetical protein
MEEQDDNKYENGKIYEIVCYETGERYVGSTTHTLEVRLEQHTWKNNSCCSKQIISRGNYYIELIENYPCETKEELLWRERYYYNTMECINIRAPIISVEERKENLKEIKQRPEVKARDRQQQKIRRNEPEAKAKAKAKRQTPEEKTKANVRYENNKAKQLAHQAERYICICGKEVTRGKKARHEKTIRHIVFCNTGALPATKTERKKCECGEEVTIKGMPSHLISRRHIRYCQNLSQDVAGVEESKHQDD